MTLRSAVPVLVLLALAPVPPHTSEHRIRLSGDDIPNHIMFGMVVEMLKGPGPGREPWIFLRMLARKVEIDTATAQKLAPMILAAGEEIRREKDNATRRILCSVYGYPEGDSVFDALTAVQVTKFEVSRTLYESFLAKLPDDQASKLIVMLEDLKQSSGYREVDHYGTRWSDSDEADRFVAKICKTLGMDYGAPPPP